MSKKALIVGLGSIGNRHAKILNEMKFVNWDVYAWRPNKDVCTYENDVAEFNCHPREISTRFDLIIISNPTDCHLTTLNDMLDTYEDCKPNILVEKPLCYPNDSNLYELDKVIEKAYMIDAEVNVGYNLRYCSPFAKVKDSINLGKLSKTYTHTAVCKTDSFSWESERSLDHVALELSHEIDYLIYLFGPIINAKVMSSEWRLHESVFLADFRHVSGFMSRVNLDLLSDVEVREFQWVDDYGFNQTSKIDQHSIDASYKKQLERLTTETPHHMKRNNIVNSRQTSYILYNTLNS